MTIRETYKKLQDKKFVKDMIVKSAHGNMCLEDQSVPKAKVLELYDKVVTSKEVSALS